MKTIKEGYKGQDVIRLCELLGIPCISNFDNSIKSEVIKFQRDNKLDADGICGPKTWLKLFINDRLQKNSSPNIVESDYVWAGEFINCESAAIKAVKDVETSGRSGFECPGKPQILFEGHIFYKELKSRGIDPSIWQKKYPSIVYPSWTKKYYKGGLGEYSRLEVAKGINEDAALESISAGLFQILGQNYKTCSCSSVKEFWNKMCESQFQQFILGVEFIRNNNLHKYLERKDWASFAKSYNGPGYKSNSYDVKLENAYKKYKK